MQIPAFVTNKRTIMKLTNLTPAFVLRSHWPNNYSCQWEYHWSNKYLITIFPIRSLKLEALALAYLIINFKVKYSWSIGSRKRKFEIKGFRFLLKGAKGQGSSQCLSQSVDSMTGLYISLKIKRGKIQDNRNWKVISMEKSDAVYCKRSENIYRFSLLYCCL